MDKYFLKHQTSDTVIGELSVDIEADCFYFLKNADYTGPLPAFLMYANGGIPESDMVKMWVMGRAPEPNAEFIDALIEKIGETKYNAYSFFKYNKGAFITDKFYVVPWT